MQRSNQPKFGGKPKRTILTGGRPTADEEALLAELHNVYTDADALLSDTTCPASTECCRFGITGREPYVTSIEIAAVEKALRKVGGARSFRRAEPLARPSETNAPPKRRLALFDERTCPLLNESGKCAVYTSRPLGCRTYFCERASSPTRARSTRGRALPQRELNDLVQRVKSIAARHQVSGDLGRALTKAIESLLK
ncbi:MAG: YkgJ family cysteine cluster protein [Polyangiaceae bacterium]|nr:YkgJ family cysteine cluster protein [Polyangiaceae bacterium]